jgi:hypothetical protein
MRKLLLLGLTAALTPTLALPLAASADGHRKPGLWDVTIQMSFTKGGPQIPPDQLAKMQQMGIKLPFGGAPQTVQHCVTPEEAAKADHPDAGKDCQMSNQSWNGNHFTADIACNGREGKMTGHIDATAGSDSDYVATTHMEGSNPQLGGDFAMDNHITGKWLSADCGGVK